MNRNNFALQLALAIVLILIAAIAGQFRKWQKHWESATRIMPGAEKKLEPFDRDPGWDAVGNRERFPDQAPYGHNNFGYSPSHHAGARHGLRPEAVFAAFGMAEATLAVTFVRPGSGLTIDTTDVGLPNTSTGS